MKSQILAFWAKQNSNRKATIVLGAIALIIWSPIYFASANRSAGKTAPRTTPKTARQLEWMADTPQGFSLYFDGSCVVAKGLTNGHLRAMGTDLAGYKQHIKDSTGHTCVLVE